MSLKVEEAWGGSWTEQKLDAFIKYVRAYLVIMGTHAPMYGWKLIYFDGFAGSGAREDTKTEHRYLLGEMEDIYPTEVYAGAAERVLCLEDSIPFDYYYFIDANAKAIAELQERMNPFVGNKKVAFRGDDANAQIIKLGEAMRKNNKLKALVFLDPFGMQIDWTSIKAIAEKGADLWILVPSGVIINRLIKRDGSFLHPDKLEQYFGLPKEELQNYFYHAPESDLFGEQVTSKKHKPIDAIVNLYIKQLKTLFTHVTNQPLILINSNNLPIFHFVFASFNKTALKIAQQIIK